MTVKPGAIRFNTDSMKLEIFRGSANYEGTASMAGIGTLAAGQWEEIQATSPEIHTGGTRGVFFAGYMNPAAYSDVISYANLDTTGNAIDFGDTLVPVNVMCGLSDRTRACSLGGSAPVGLRSKIEFITIASTGDGVEFGDLTQARYGSSGVSNSTRGVILGGLVPGPTSVNTIDYITISSTGDAVDFGDRATTCYYGASANSPTRGVVMGGLSPGNFAGIEFITISTQGNGSDFGDLSVAGRLINGGSGGNSIRGIAMGRWDGSTYHNIIEYVTISTLGNAQDFGDLSAGRIDITTASSPTRVVSYGGITPTYLNIMEYVQTMTTGNSIDFGDTVQANIAYGSAASNGHGGL